jgi:hypothetical protein
MTGNDWRTRESTMRQGGSDPRTRDSRLRPLPTNHGPAALRRTLDVTREYQLDSSSKRPEAPRLLNALKPKPPTVESKALDKGSFYISGPGVDHGG